MATVLRAEAAVDLAAVRDNVAALRAAAGEAEVMAVVKADGYGHGLVPCARAAVAGGASWLGVAFVEEALALRAAGVSAPTLAWLFAPAEPRLSEAVAAGVDLSVSAVWAVAEVAAAARACGVPARVHLKADTGLGRGGAPGLQWADLLAAAGAAAADGSVRVVAVWSHLAHADAPAHPTTERQAAAFRDAVAAAESAGFTLELRHLANSAVTLTRRDLHFDLVRPGLAVYGLTPVPETAPPERLGLRPAMTLRARVALAKRVPAGSGVSYGHRYTTAREATLALVPLGYADGVPRDATNTAEVWVAGRRRRIAGSVCMDQFVLDVGDDPVREGDEVVLFGPGGGGEPTAQEWADALGTISYEIVTRVGPRVPRTYDGEPG
ncbi:MAG TPA: alanine racemase [Mycobacteriales bacterium]|nr:alanine racemase [Mycobacteriales bacterium]